MNKSRLNEVLVKVEQDALKQLDDHVDQFLPDYHEFVECLIRDIMNGVFQGLAPDMAEDDESNKEINCE